MKLHLPKLLLTAVMAAGFVSSTAWGSDEASASATYELSYKLTGARDDQSTVQTLNDNFYIHVQKPGDTVFLGTSNKKGGQGNPEGYATVVGEKDTENDRYVYSSTDKIYEWVTRNNGGGTTQSVNLATDNTTITVKYDGEKSSLFVDLNNSGTSGDNIFDAYMEMTGEHFDYDKMVINPNNNGVTISDAFLKVTSGTLTQKSWITSYEVAATAGLNITSTITGSLTVADGGTLVVTSLDALDFEYIDEIDYSKSGSQALGVNRVVCAGNTDISTVFIGSTTGNQVDVKNGLINDNRYVYVVANGETLTIGNESQPEGLDSTDFFALADTGTLTIAGAFGNKSAGMVLSETIGTGIINVQCAAGTVNSFSEDFEGSLIVGSGGSMTLSCRTVNLLGGTLEVDGGSLMLNRDGSGNPQLKKSISVKNHGTLTVNVSDLISDTDSTTVAIQLDSSTMKVGGNRFTMGANHTIEMKSSDITGSGDAHGLIDISKSTSISSSGSSSIEGAIRIRGGAVLSLNLTDTLTIGTIVHSGSLNIASTSSGTLKITSMVNKTEAYHTGATSLGAGVTLDYAIDKDANDAALSGAYSGVISGEGKVLKSKAGVVTLSGANTYSGGTDINAGTLVAANTSALGTGKVVMNGGTLQQNGAALTVSAMDYKSGTVDNGGQNLRVEGTLNVESKMEITGTGATSIGTLNLALGLSSDSAAVTTSGALTLGNITLDLTNYEAGNYTLVSATGNGSIIWDDTDENALSYTGLGERLEASVGFGSDNKTLQLTISEMVTPSESLITATVVEKNEGGSFVYGLDGTTLTLTLTVDTSLAGLAEGGIVELDLISDEMKAAILASLTDLETGKVTEMVTLKLTDGNTDNDIIAGKDAIVGFFNEKHEGYFGENVGNGVQYNVNLIPEPASATLSLAALMMLCARRRRRA